MKKIKTTINTCFFDFATSRKALIDNSAKDYKAAEVDKECKKIFEAGRHMAFMPDDDYFSLVTFSNDSDSHGKGKKDVQLIYRLDKYYEKSDKENEKYSFATGPYCGIINFGDKLQSLEIQTGYSDLFFERMLNFCCGIYIGKDVSDTSSEKESIYSLITQYMFLISLRKVIGKAIPKKYVEIRDRGYEIKGNVDVEAYICHDLLAFDKKITYKYSKRLEIQSIIDVLYTALKCCKINANESMPNLVSFREHIKNLYSGIRPSKAVVNNILREKCLSNSLYADFIHPLKYAQILIKHNDLNAAGDKKTNSASGYLVDSSFLWEIYLYNLMRLHLPDWEIDSQREFSFYQNTFYSKNNRPDFILRNRNNGKVFVLDAKFKRMYYENYDVDNLDIRQLHAYSYYFHLTEGDRFAGAGLIYPTKIDRPKEANNVDNIYGIESTSKRFGIFSIKDPAKGETMAGNEQAFISELRAFLEG